MLVLFHGLRIEFVDPLREDVILHGTTFDILRFESDIVVTSTLSSSYVETHLIYFLIGCKKTFPDDQSTVRA